MKTNTTNKFTKIILNIMFFTGILIILTLPVTLKCAGEYYSNQIMEHYYGFLIIFSSAGILAIMIIDQLRKMMNTVIKENCFVYENVKSLEIMAVLSLIISILFIVKCFFAPTPATVIIVIVFFIAALFSRVLAHVFYQAVTYKEENDLTI